LPDQAAVVEESWAAAIGRQRKPDNLVQAVGKIALVELVAERDARFGRVAIPAAKEAADKHHRCRSRKALADLRRRLPVSGVIPKEAIANKRILIAYRVERPEQANLL
jgi:hypothetical protein